MALRASISLISLQASVSTERLTASTAYNKSEATEIWTDPDSKNRVVRDEMPLSEVHFTLLEKNLADAYNVTDSNTLSFDKASTDAISFTDTFVNVIAYHRKFNDAFTLDDLAAVDKDFYGNKGNIFAFTDIIGLTYAKELTDTYTVGDFIAAAVNKVAQDSFSFTDTSYATFSKTINDAFTLDDAAMIDKDYYGNKGNVAFMLDVIGLSAAKVATDSVTVGDVYNAAINKVVTENLSLIETQVKSYNVTKADNFSATDLFSMARGLNKSDSVSFSDTYYAALNKIVTDSMTMTEVVGIGTGIPITESFSISDSIISEINKVIADAFTLDDSALIDKNYYGNKGNICTVSDVIAIAISYVRGYSDSISTSDSASIANISGKVLNGASFNRITLN
jgi:hypothetical protein